MTNFEIIEWLIKDGGQYTREQHITLLQQNFPELDITESKVTSNPPARLLIPGDSHVIQIQIIGPSGGRGRTTRPFC